jgi:hypothetical protein
MKTSRHVEAMKAEAAALTAFGGRPSRGERASLVRLPAITRGREEWYVDRWAVTEDKRVRGRLMCGPEVVRETFSVRVDDNGRFKVDIGTGSGVRIEFEVAS